MAYDPRYAAPPAVDSSVELRRGPDDGQRDAWSGATFPPTQPSRPHPPPPLFPAPPPPSDAKYSGYAAEAGSDAAGYMDPYAAGVTPDRRAAPRQAATISPYDTASAAYKGIGTNPRREGRIHGLARSPLSATSSSHYQPTPARTQLGSGSMSLATERIDALEAIERTEAAAAAAERAPSRPTPFDLRSCRALLAEATSLVHALLAGADSVVGAGQGADTPDLRGVIARLARVHERVRSLVLAASVEGETAQSTPLPAATPAVDTAPPAVDAGRLAEVVESVADAADRVEASRAECEQWAARVADGERSASELRQRAVETAKEEAERAVAAAAKGHSRAVARDAGRAARMCRFSALFCVSAAGLVAFLLLVLSALYAGEEEGEPRL